LSPAEVRLVVALAIAPTGLLLMAAPAALWWRARWVGAAILALAAAGPLALLAAFVRTGGNTPPPDVPLFAWSPLGLYGVVVAARPSPSGALLALPPLFLALCGWLMSPRAGSGRRAADALGHASALVGLAGAQWTGVAADFVSLHGGVVLYLLGTAGLLWVGAGAAPAGRRVTFALAAGAALLACVLILGRVNGHFRLSGFSTAGFTAPAFFGLALAAAAAAAVPPFHGWLLRVGRHPLAPALAAGGAGVALVLLLAAFRITGGAFAADWQRWLAAAGWVAALVGAGVAIARRAPPVRFAALFCGNAGLVFLAAAVATPVSMAAALLHVALGLPALAVVWLTALGSARPGGPPTGNGVTGPAAASPDRRPPRAYAPTGVAPWGRGRGPDNLRVWAYLLVLASAAGLPATVGGVSTTALVASLTAWPAGDQLLRAPLLVLDVAALAAGGDLLRRRPARFATHPLAAGALLATAAGLVVGPALAPSAMIGGWFGPVAAEAVGTGTGPLALGITRVPSLTWGLLGLAAGWALARRLRGREWLPAIVRTGLGALALGSSAVRRGWRRRGLAAAPAGTGNAAWRRLQAGAGRLVDAIRPLEERYYAAAAVMLAAALISIIGR
jgi:formate hydrogenlyase subunit 3/multisubunit Na+/H+ antiporter MnhD subunit